jgi:hypothetical protein
MPNVFAHSQLTSQLLVQRGISANTLAAAGTVNTYDVAPQPAAGIDSHNDQQLQPRRLLMVIDVSELSDAGSLAITLRDSNAAITTANGDASTNLAVTLDAITAAGLYYAEIPFTHVFPEDSTRYAVDEDYAELARYHSVRAVATGCDFTFSVTCIYGHPCGGFPDQVGTELDLTWYDT